MTPNQQLVVDLTYLRGAGVEIDQIRSLHHMGKAGGTYARMIKYFGEEHPDMKAETNLAFAARVRLAAGLHARGVSDFVGAALKAHPL